MNLKKLAEFFPPEKIEFRIGVTNSDKTQAIALAYVTNRAIQERLDEVCGPENWKNEFMPWKGDHQLCGISIRVDGEWITKWDGAENTQTEPLKGGLSASMKRAAAQWGIGRYLYDVPNKWYNIIKKGKGYIFTSSPTLPKSFLPAGSDNNGYQVDVATDEDIELFNLRESSEKLKITKEQSKALAEIIITNQIDINKLLKFGKVEKVEDLTQAQYGKILEIYEAQQFKIPETAKALGVSKEETKRLSEMNKKAGGKK